MRALVVLIPLLCLGGCGFVFGPGYGSADRHYFAEQPVIVHTGTQYALRWRYGSMGFYFFPGYAVRDGRLIFSLQGTSSTGSRSGREQLLPIEDPKAIAALRTAGAFWWEPNGTLTPLTVLEANQSPEPTPLTSR